MFGTYNNGFNQPMYMNNYQNNNTLRQPITPSMGGLMGKVVDSADVVKVTDIPLDGSTSYFPLVDGSAILTKKLQVDGTSKIVVYKPVVEEPKETPKYVTYAELDDIKKHIKDLEDKLNEQSDKQ